MILFSNILLYSDTLRLYEVLVIWVYRVYIYINIKIRMTHMIFNISYVSKINSGN